MQIGSFKVVAPIGVSDTQVLALKDGHLPAEIAQTEVLDCADTLQDNGHCKCVAWQSDDYIFIFYSKPC